MCVRKVWFCILYCDISNVQKPWGERETFVFPPKNVHVLSRISSVFHIFLSSKMFFSCVEPSEFSIFMFFMFSCENHLSKKNKNIFPIFTPFDTRKIKFHVWNREKKIILMWNLFYFHMQKKDFTCENVFSWLDTWKHSSPHQIVYTWKKYWELGEKMPLVVKMRITEWNTFFFFTPLTQHIFSLDTWKYFFHVWNRVNFFFHSGKLIFRA